MKLFVIFLFLLPLHTLAYPTREAATNIITYWPDGFRVDETPQGQRVRRLLEKIKALGMDTVIFNFRARMIGGTSSDIRSVVELQDQPEEERLIEETAHYAQNIGLQVAFRPILLVVGPHGEFPYTENGFTWWHGNIRPANVATWFQSFFDYHCRYMRLARKVNAVWYSVGAEMHSMTSGLGSRSPLSRFGYPLQWVQFINQARTVLGPHVMITYGVNYTDQYVLEDGVRTWGGEFEQWRHDLTFTPKNPTEEQHQENMKALWRSLDFAGLDYYRALGSAKTKYPANYNDLVPVLYSMSEAYALSLDQTLAQISTATETHRPLAIQEVGYRSVEKCFVSPYLYEGDHTPINYQHQAAAWDALLASLWNEKRPWMRGVGLWQVLLDDDSDLEINAGFSPLGKEPAEQVLKKYFQPVLFDPVQ